MFVGFGCASTPASDGGDDGCDEGCESGGDDGAGSTGGADPSDDDDDDDDSAGSDEGGEPASDMPCEVQELLAAECWGCHGDPVQFGAPMSLTSIEALMVPAATDATRPVHELVVERMSDAERPMPPDGVLDPAQRAIVEDWLAAGLPASEGDDCEPEGPAEDPVGPEYLPCDADSLVLAGAAGGGGFEVPVVDDLYACFVFDSPFTADQQGIAWAPVIDDARVVHHMLLLTSDDPDLEAGSAVPDCASLTVGSNMVMGWAPGSKNFIMPDDVGLELPDPGDKLILQVHYNNAAGHMDVADESGFAMCTTPESRENAAGTLWLGTLDISIPPGETGFAAGDCNTNRLDEPVNLMMSWPHMHEYGRSIRTDIVRDGEAAIEELVDVSPWNWDNQIYYPHEPPVVVNPGDTLRTTCGFENTTGDTLVWGEGTGDEMCFNFVLAYPIDAFDLSLPFVPPEIGRFCLELPSGGGGTDGG